MNFEWLRRQLHLDTIETRLTSLEKIGRYLMSAAGAGAKALTDLQTAVANETTVDQSAVTLIQGLAAAVAALPQTDGMVAAADVEALVATMNGNATGLAGAVTAGTPAAPQPVQQA